MSCMRCFACIVLYVFCACGLPPPTHAERCGLWRGGNGPRVACATSTPSLLSSVFFRVCILLLFSDGGERRSGVEVECVPLEHGIQLPEELRAALRATRYATVYRACVYVRTPPPCAV